METDKVLRLTVQAFKKHTRDYPKGDWIGKTETHGLYTERTKKAVTTVQQSCPGTGEPAQSTVQGYTFLYVDGARALLTVGFHWSTGQKHIEFIVHQLHCYKAPVKVLVLDDSILRRQGRKVGCSVASDVDSQVQKSIRHYPACIPGDKYLVVMFLAGRMGFRVFDHLGNPLAV